MSLFECLRNYFVVLQILHLYLNAVIFESYNQLEFSTDDWRHRQVGEKWGEEGEGGGGEEEQEEQQQKQLLMLLLPLVLLALAQCSRHNSTQRRSSVDDNSLAVRISYLV